MTLKYSFLRPYRFKLALISELFEPGFISKSEEYGFSGDLDAEALKTMFNSVAQEYCSTILGKSETECSEELKGCGLNDNCPLDEKCRNSPNSPDGYECFGERCVYIYTQFG